MEGLTMTSNIQQNYKDLHELSKGELTQYLKDTVKAEDGIIPAYIFSHPRVYELEMERIFLKPWLLVAHESEVPEKGDFVARVVGGYNVMASHGAAGGRSGWFGACIL